MCGQVLSPRDHLGCPTVRCLHQSGDATTPTQHTTPQCYVRSMLSSGRTPQCVLHATSCMPHTQLHATHTQSSVPHTQLHATHATHTQSSVPHTQLHATHATHTQVHTLGFTMQGTGVVALGSRLRCIVAHHGCMHMQSSGVVAMGSRLRCIVAHHGCMHMQSSGVVALGSRLRCIVAHHGCMHMQSTGVVALGSRLRWCGVSAVSVWFHTPPFSDPNPNQVDVWSLGVITYMCAVAKPPFPINARQSHEARRRTMAGEYSMEA